MFQIRSRLAVLRSNCCQQTCHRPARAAGCPVSFENCEKVDLKPMVLENSRKPFVQHKNERRCAYAEREFLAFS